MFARLAQTIGSEGYPVERLRYYLQRHIEVDTSEHGPLARKLVEYLCGESERRWCEAAEAARAALEARIRLWDGILEVIGAGRAGLA